MNTIKENDLSKILRPYSDEWVALSHDEKRVVSHNKILKIAINEANKKGEANPIMTRAPKDYSNYVLGM